MTNAENVNDPKLSVIIPLRENGNIDVLERLAWKSIPQTSEIEVIVVDDGSQNPDPVANYCKSVGWQYIYLHTKDAPFSLSRARNTGIKASGAEYLYFEDVDFLHQSNFYDKLIEITASLEESPFNFAAVPTLFLTAEASEQLIEEITDRKAFDKLFSRYLNQLPFINPDEPNSLCDSFAPVGSNILVRRDTCFHVGLFDEYFNGWGGEDRDFVYRLLDQNSFLSRPRDFPATKPWRIHRTNAYEGWRAAYRLHGDWLRSIGVYAVHIHHPDNTWKDPDARRANFSYAETKAKEIGSGRRKQNPIPFSSSKGLNVFIGRNPVFYNDEVMKLLGSVQVIDPDHHMDPGTFASEVGSMNPERIFFQNPYGNDWLLAVWNLLRSNGFRCICAERGGVPGSIYFDENGFCCESTSYTRDRWQESAPVDASKYLSDLRTQAQFLEPQGSTPIENLQEFLDPTKRTVLVLLQSLTDTTTRHFCRPLANYDEFLGIVKELASLDNYNVLVKNHPLNKAHPLPGTGIGVDAYSIYDLFGIADTVVTLNSGAGMLALAAGLQVITLGSAFYAQEGLANPANNLSSVLESIENGKGPLREDVDRFFGYLLNDFYSFAEWIYKSRDYSDKTKLSMMGQIRYKKIIIGDLAKTISKEPLKANGLIMDPYALDLFLAKKRTSTPTRTAGTMPSKEANDNDTRLRKLASFKAYAGIYGRFLSQGQRSRLINNPTEFFGRARHPVTRLGKVMFRKYL